jgi:hypothetical protein
MKFTFTVNPEGINFIKEHDMFCYPNVARDEDKSTVTLELPEPDKATVGQFMTVIKDRGLLIGKNHGNPIALDSKHIIEYPYELEAL